MPRLALLLVVFLAACTEKEVPPCPGEIVGAFAFTGDARSAGELPAGLDPDPALTDCAAEIGFPPSLPAFSATLAGDAAGSFGAMCRANGAVVFGTHAGTRWALEDDTGGAVLGGCDPTCAARQRVVITGDVLPGSPAAFQGGLVEQLTRTGGECGACALPCAKRYALSGAAGAP